MAGTDDTVAARKNAEALIPLFKLDKVLVSGMPNTTRLEPSFRFLRHPINQPQTRRAAG